MNTKPSIKATMQQALDMLEKGGLNCEQEEFVAQSLRKAIADCEHADEQKPVEIHIIIDDSDPQNPIFVEIEDKYGKSINYGVHSTTKEGYRSIAIYTHPPIKRA